MNFGDALEVLKSGGLVARSGWNGKGMFIFMRPEDEIDAETIITKIKSVPLSFKNWLMNDFEGRPQLPKDVKIKFTSYLCMKAADGTIVNGWLASQTDMLTEDWQVL